MGAVGVQWPSQASVTRRIMGRNVRGSNGAETVELKRQLQGG
jgi:hypothetical protein